MITKADIKSYAKLKQKKYSEQESKLLIEGEKLIFEAVYANWKFETTLIHSETNLSPELKSLLESRFIPIEQVPHKDFIQLSDTVSPQQIIGIAKIKPVEHGIPGLTPVSLLLDSVSDPGNVGTILRTADWFGGINVYFSGSSADIYNAKVIRASMGAAFRTNFYKFSSEDEAIDFIRKQDGVIYCADLGGEPLSALIQNSKKTVLILGNEAHGPSGLYLSAADKKISIEGRGKAESLNVAIAAGILLYSFSGR